MGACREMRLPRSESESQSMSPSAALDSTAAAPAAIQKLLAYFGPLAAASRFASGVASIAFSIRFSRGSRRVNR